MQLPPRPTKTISSQILSKAPLLWFTLGFAATMVQILKGSSSYNNYLIFKGVFVHTRLQLNLFDFYPSEYSDNNHYGPAFSLVIAPFTLFPDWLGCLLWGIANTAFLYYAIRQLPVSATQKNTILLFAAVEMMTAAHNTQSNAMVTAWLLLSLICIQKEKEGWACFFIMLASFVKLYGIVALAFFFFSKNKLRFILHAALWAVIMFAAPMLLSSPEYIIQSYNDWLLALQDKNHLNATSVMQNVSAMKVVNQFFPIPADYIYFLIIAGIAITFPLTKYRLWFNTCFQLHYLAALLITIVIFSSSAENATYIFAITGVGIWFVVQDKKNIFVWTLFLFAFLFTSLSSTDFFPKLIKTDFIRPYGIKALPCLIIWITVIAQLFASTLNKPILSHVEKNHHRMPGLQ